jgi:hypothetical protein
MLARQVLYHLSHSTTLIQIKKKKIKQAKKYLKKIRVPLLRKNSYFSLLLFPVGETLTRDSIPQLSFFLL